MKLDEIEAQSAQLRTATLSDHSRALGIFPRRWLRGGGGVGHAIACKPFRLRWWPPFYSLDVFAPRLMVRMQNCGDALPGWSIVLYIARYAGPLTSMSQDADGWLEADRVSVLKPWPARGVQVARLAMRSGALGEPATYVARLRVSRLEETSPGTWSGFEVLEYDISSYFRIEPLSSVLTFGVIAATFATAIATLAVGLATLLK